MAETKPNNEETGKRPFENRQRGGEGSGPRGGTGRNGDKKTDWQEMKIRNAQDMSSIVLLPRSTHGRIIADTLRQFDKALNQIFRRMGVYISPEEANTATRRAAAFAAGLQSFVEKTFQGGARIDIMPNPMDNPQEKLTLAQSPNSFVYIPSCKETGVVARAARVLDFHMIHFFNSCEDEKRRTEVVNGLREQILAMHATTEELTKVAIGNDSNLAKRMKYRPAAGVRKMLGLSEEDDRKAESEAVGAAQPALPLDKPEKAGKGAKALAA